MALKTIDQSPKITDTILFELETPDADGCFLSNPYKVDKVIIYFVERSYASKNLKQFNKTIENEEKRAEADAARKLACTSPTTLNVATADRLETELVANAHSEVFYFTEAKPVAFFGTEDFPAWLSTDIDNALITNVSEDDDGETQYGRFQFEWKPLGMREGDYFICWTWTPLAAGGSMSDFIQFDIGSDINLTVAIPSQATKENKYETLLEAYTPEQVKSRICDGDLTPETLSNLNNAIAKGFTFLEDMGNQIQGLYDANAIPESMLPLLGNTFNLKLRSADPTLWRRQIKRAIPLFKKKGTLEGLSEALNQAGINLTKYTKLWQLISSYTWVEAFNVAKDGETSFALAKVPILPVDTNNFELEIRASGTDTWTVLNENYASLSINDDGVGIMTWTGSTAPSPIILNKGDTIKVLYQIKEVPNATAQAVEDFVRTLELKDQRDDRLQTYPPKNWNVRVIEEDDVMFDIVIPTKHPFVEPVIFGKIRTEFPFGENIYNMDEWDGSTRDTTDPGKINKDFVDCCSACCSSKFNISIEIEDLSDDRIVEANDIINEFTPFHAVLHEMSVAAAIEEFCQCGVESIEVLGTETIDETVLSGEGQIIFSRTMEHGNVVNSTSLMPSEKSWGEAITRDMLTDLEAVGSGTATASSEQIVLYSSEVRFDRIGVSNSAYLEDPDSYVAGSNNNVLEIFGPHANAGSYVLSGPVGENFMRVDQGAPDSISEPISGSSAEEFTFRLSNILYSNTTNSIIPDDIYKFTDADVNFSNLAGIQTIHDVGESLSSMAWKVKITSPGGIAGTYLIENILPDGSLLLRGFSSGTSTTSSINYKIKNSTGVTQITSDTGKLEVEKRGLVTITDSSIDDIRNLFKRGYYVVHSGSQYEIIGFAENETHQLYISDWTGSAVSGSIQIYKRLIQSAVGKVDYYGLKLTTVDNYEVDLGVVNGVNAAGYPWTDGGFEAKGTALDDAVSGQSSTQTLRENLLVMIPNGSEQEYFAISDIDGEEISLVGPKQTWPTTGTNKSFTIYKASKKSFTVPEQIEPPGPGHTFEYLDRRGKSIITTEQETSVSMMLRASLLNAADKGQLIDFVGQEESIGLTIEYVDGTKEQYEE